MFLEAAPAMQQYVWHVNWMPFFKMHFKTNQFSGQSTIPFTPHASLYAMWMSQKHLSGYSQQDAHEYFISLLDEVHKNCNESSTQSCNCIIHNAFGGVLQSDLTCTSCGTVSLTLDPFLDLSLEIRSSNIKQAGTKKKKVQTATDIISIPEVEEISLQECLEEYTIPEKLNLAQYSCKSCSQSVVKQLSFKALPPILSIQLKVNATNEAV